MFCFFCFFYKHKTKHSSIALSLYSCEFNMHDGNEEANATGINAQVSAHQNSKSPSRYQYKVITKIPYLIVFS